MNSHTYKPVIAFTMGDPAGIGPEITLRALLDADLHTYSHPLVIGSKKTLEKVANVIKKPVFIHVIDEPGVEEFEIGKIDVIETGMYDEDTIRWGKFNNLREECRMIGF